MTPTSTYAPDMDELRIEGSISKVDADERQVFGWASVTEVNGEPVVDLQGDLLDTYELEKAAYDYVVNSRVGGEMHERVGKTAPKQIGTLIESMVITPEKIEKMGLPESTPQGWWIGFQVDKGEVGDQAWSKLKKGEYTGFSIHGIGKRKSIEKKLTERSREEIAGWFKRMGETVGTDASSLANDLDVWMKNEGVEDPSDDDLHEFLMTTYGDEVDGRQVRKLLDIEKHLVGRHDQQDHDPTKGKGHERKDHDTQRAVAGAGLGGIAGLLAGGPLGALLGGALGAESGTRLSKPDKKAERRRELAQYSDDELETMIHDSLVRGIAEEQGIDSGITERAIDRRSKAKQQREIQRQAEDIAFRNLTERVGEDRAARLSGDDYKSFLADAKEQESRIRDQIGPVLKVDRDSMTYGPQARRRQAAGIDDTADYNKWMDSLSSSEQKEVLKMLQGPKSNAPVIGKAARMSEHVRKMFLVAAAGKASSHQEFADNVEEIGKAFEDADPETASYFSAVHKHLIGRHEQADHDPTKKKGGKVSATIGARQHSRGEHSRGLQTGLLGTAAAGLGTAALMTPQGRAAARSITAGRTGQSLQNVGTNFGQGARDVVMRPNQFLNNVSGMGWANAPVGLAHNIPTSAAYGAGGGTVAGGIYGGLIGGASLWDQRRKKLNKRQIEVLEKYLGEDAL